MRANGSRRGDMGDFLCWEDRRCNEELDRSFEQPQEHPGNRDEMNDDIANAGLLCIGHFICLKLV